MRYSKKMIMIGGYGHVFRSMLQFSCSNFPAETRTSVVTRVKRGFEQRERRRNKGTQGGSV